MRMALFVFLVASFWAACAAEAELVRRQVSSLPGQPLQPITSSPTSMSVSPPTPTSTLSTSAPYPTQYLLFNLISNTTACGPVPITWNYVGSPGNLTLLITNHDIEQAPPSTISRAVTPIPLGTPVTLPARLRKRDVTQVLATSMDPAALTWTWQTVNVSQGWYAIDAIIVTPTNIIGAGSQQFYVADGANTTCLASSSSASSSSAMSTSSGATIPIAGDLGTTNHHVGAIAGGVIGGLAALFAIIAAIFWFRLRRGPTRPRARSISGGGPGGYGAGKLGKWGGLTSTESHDINSTNIPHQQYRYQNHSMEAGSIAGTTLHGGQSVRGGVADVVGYIRGGPSDSEVNSLEGEKSSPTAAGPFEGIAPLSFKYSPKRSSTSSSLASSVYNVNRPRSISTHAPYGLTKHDSHGSKRSRRRESVDGAMGTGIASMSPPSYRSPVDEEFPYPPQSPTQMHSPEAGAAAMTRTPSTGARRTPRKAVPKYTADEFGLSDAETTASFSASASTHNFSASTQNFASSTHNLGGNEGVPLPMPMHLPELNLAHKSSFGDMKPMHYILPDMPPPARE